MVIRFICGYFQNKNIYIFALPRNSFAIPDEADDVYWISTQNVWLALCINYNGNSFGLFTEVDSS
jgi:hypothetical protein